MKIAFYSPLPPAKSGIADYSAAVLEHLPRFADVEVFADAPAKAHNPARADIDLYQLGNNPFHIFAYEAALARPGVVVLHEANLHHLIAAMTIRRDDWDAYLREVEINGGQEALDFAARYVRTLKAGPNYDLPMLRTILDRSLGAIVHSDAVRRELRAHGFTGPIAKIPHGAWGSHGTGDRMGYRTRLGLNETTPLIGIFGFLKPYKRIAESLRAFRRLIRLVPEARLILVGEAHPELPLASMLESMQLTANARHLDFLPIEDFNGYISACDIVLNLRYPTVGESSGTLLRALGMGKAVVVSDVGSFSEYPDEICLKAPVDASEEEHLFEYLNLLVSRPELARAMGARAQAWVERECNWESVARRYAEFLEAVVSGKTAGTEWTAPEPLETNLPATGSLAATATASAVAPAQVTNSAPPASANGHAPTATSAPVPGDYIASWAPDAGARSYIATHLTRLEKTLAITPPGGPLDRVLEMGAYLQITPALQTRLGYGEVRGCYYGPSGTTDVRSVTSETGETFSCQVDLFDAEKDRFPYPDGHFATVLCCELIEHLPTDPMHLMGEVNRILAPGGHFVLTTPNIASLRALAGILQGFHPMLFPAYIKPNPSGESDSRHAREYTPHEIQALFENSGFELTLLETGPFRAAPNPELGWVEHLLDRYILSKEHRGDGIYAVGRKTGAVRERYPDWLYN